jgi:hypothetical protein
MFRSGLAISGTVLLVVGLAVIALLRFDAWRAESVDFSDLPRAAVVPLSLSLEIPRRTMDLHQDQIATVRIENLSSEHRVFQVSISAPGFAVDQNQSWTLEPGSNRIHKVVLHAKEPGYFYVLVQSEGYQVSKGLSVRQYGLPAGVVQWIGVGSAIGGTALTVPWWIRFFKKRAAAKSAKRIILPPGS